MIGQELLARKLVLAMESGNRSIVSADDIVTVVSKAQGGGKSGSGKKPKPTENGDNGDVPPKAEKQG